MTEELFFKRVAERRRKIEKQRETRLIEKYRKSKRFEIGSSPNGEFEKFIAECNIHAENIEEDDES